MASGCRGERLARPPCRLRLELVQNADEAASAAASKLVMRGIFLKVKFFFKN